MKIKNNTKKIVTLINGKRVPAYGEVTITEKTDELMEQIENLIAAGTLEASF